MDTPSSGQSGPRSGGTESTQPDARRKKNKDEPAISFEKFASFSKSWFMQFALLVVMALYTLIGALLFTIIEGNNERHQVQKLQGHRKELLAEYQRLAIETKDCSGGGEALKKWEQDIRAIWETNPRAIDGKKFSSDELAWQFWNSIFFAMTIYTALGFGHIVPATTPGRALVIGYALIGIPLFLMILTNLGKFLANTIKKLYSITCRRCVLARRRRRATASSDSFEKDDEFTLPVSLALSIFFGSIMFGAVIYWVLQSEWTFFESFYFVFISISTVGFGDFCPTTPGVVMFTVVYLICGLALGVMCIEAVRQYIAARIAQATSQLVTKFRNIDI